MKLAKEYKQHMMESYVEALRSLVAANPNLTAKALRGLVDDYPALADVRLSEILDGAPAKAKGKTKAAKAKKQGGKAGAKKKWNVRSPDGRKALEAAVLEALGELGSKDVAAQDIRKALGATPAQIRTTLNRHIEAGAVTFTGKARGTRYTLA